MDLQRATFNSLLSFFVAATINKGSCSHSFQLAKLKEEAVYSYKKRAEGSSKRRERSNGIVVVVSELNE